VAPPLQIANCALVRLLWSEGAVALINVLAASKPGTVVINQGLANTLGAAIKNDLTTSGLANKLHSSISLQKVGIKDVSTPYNVEYFDTGAGVPGLATGDPLPTQTALVITLRTAKAGKSFRGRVYIGGWGELSNDPNHVCEPVSSAAALAFVNSINTSLIASGMHLAVASRPAEKVVTTVETIHADGTTSTKVTTLNARTGTTQDVVAVELRNSVWDSQRRRGAAGSISTLFGPQLHMDVTN
jgi:hypothetical protein